MSEPLVLGIDGGGSKTLLMLADSEGRIVDTAQGGPINPLDRRDWQAALGDMLTPFARQNLAGIGAGLPAHGEVEAISAAQRDVIATAFGERPQRVLNDVDAAHIGAFAGGPGILILSGTGSMAWARDAGGKSYRTGGWGDIIGDEGSSHWIGKRVLTAVSQATDGRAEPTALVDAVCEKLGVRKADFMNGLEGWVAEFGNPRAQIATLAPLATELATTGDPAAQRIVADAAAELARHITAIAHLANLPLEWSYAGGTFRSQALRDAVAAIIGRPPVAPKLPPIGGALLAAAQHLDWPRNRDWIARLAASLEALPAKTDHQPRSANSN